MPIALAARPVGPPPGLFASHCRSTMIRAIEQVVRDNPPRIDRHLAEILGAYVGEPDLLSGIACPADETRYARHLLHAGDLYSVLAIVWMPGQMSPVHGHKTWCASACISVP